MKTSIVIPAYNEEKRIIPLLDALKKYSKTYEIIVVNDGSKDKTSEAVKKYKNINLIDRKKNKGKGYTVKEGMLKARGDNIIFMDADMSIKTDQIPKLTEALEKYDVALGSRNLKDSKAKRDLKRKILSIIFNFLVSTMFNLKYSDYLCGFKGFRKEIVKELFEKVSEKGWVFDVELMYYIKIRKYSVKEVPIEWEEKEGSKITNRTVIKMLKNLFTLKKKLNF